MWVDYFGTVLDGSAREFLARFELLTYRYATAYYGYWVTDEGLTVVMYFR